MRRVLISVAILVTSLVMPPAGSTPTVGPPELYVLDLMNGGKPQRLAQASTQAFFAPSWSPDSQTIAFDTGFGIQLVAADGRGALRVGGEFEHQPDWAPAGDELAVRSSRNNAIEDVFAMNIATGDLRPLAETEGDDSTPRWSPDGTQVAFLGDVGDGSRLFIVDSDGSDLSQVSSVRAEEYDWSPDGDSLVFSSAGDVFLVNADGSDERMIKDNDSTHCANGPVWSPDGTQIAYGENFGVAVMDADGSDSRHVYESQGAIFDPQWSPDGEMIAFSFDSLIHRVDVDSGEDSFVDVPDGFERFPQWSPDGTKLAFLHSPVSGGSNEGLLTIRYDRRQDAFVGSISASKRRCQEGRTIDLYRDRRDGRVRLGIDRTNPRGNWRIDRKIRHGRFYAVARRKSFIDPSGNTIVCRLDRSVTIRV